MADDDPAAQLAAALQARLDGGRRTVRHNQPRRGGRARARWRLRNNTSANAGVRDLAEPAPTMYFGRRINTASWVRDGGGAVRLEVAEAAAFQTFPPGWPLAGTESEQFRQVGDAVPPLLALHILAMATGRPVPAGPAAAVRAAW